MDFDGVLTDNTVFTSADGTEFVRCNKYDSLGLNMVQEAGVKCVVISKERNPVVAARCQKMGLECYSGVENKHWLLANWLEENGIAPHRSVYIGNDVNDLQCYGLVGTFYCPSDAHPTVIARADCVLSYSGGNGAVRELCEILLKEGE